MTKAPLPTWVQPTRAHSREVRNLPLPAASINDWYILSIVVQTSTCCINTSIPRPEAQRPRHPVPHTLEPRIVGGHSTSWRCGQDEPHALPPPVNRTFFASRGCVREDGIKAIKDGNAYLIGNGRAFIANPDLPRRFELDTPLSPWMRELFYSTSRSSGEVSTLPWSSWKQIWFLPRCKAVPIGLLPPLAYSSPLCILASSDPPHSRRHCTLCKKTVSCVVLVPSS